jgi:hypothetical protein
MGINYQFKNNVDDMSQTYNNYILRAYNQLEKNNSKINKTITNDYKLIVKFKDILNGFNAKLILSNIDRKNNILEHYLYASDGSYEMEVIPLKTQSNTKRAIINLGKYFFKNKISTKFQSLYEWRKNPIYLNQRITKKQYETWLLMASIRIPVIDKLSVYFDLKQSKYLFENKAQNFTQYDIKNDIYLYPLKSHQINISSNYFWYQDSKEGLFINLTYRYKPSKKHWSLYAVWQNITGLESYTSYFSNAIYTYKSTYILRPSQLIIGFKSTL